MEKKYKRLKIVTGMLILILIACIYLLFRGGVVDKILVKLNFKEAETVNSISEYTLSVWKESLEKMDYDADIVFFGDSITQASDFQEYFVAQRIVNLGVPGDDLEDMIARTDMITMVSPEKIFVMGGINSFKSEDYDTCYEQYVELVEKIKEENPVAKIYLQSLLPISEEREEDFVSNEIIRKFNEDIEVIAEMYGCTFIELYDLMETDGYLDEKYSADGLHLTDEAYDVWAGAIAGYME